MFEILTYLFYIFIGWISIGLILGTLVYKADIYFADLSVQPECYRITSKDIRKKWPYYFIGYMFCWFRLIRYDFHTIKEYLL